MDRRIGQPELLKRINLARVLELLRRRRLISRAELAETTGLSRSTISLLTDRLLARGIVSEEGLGTSRGGRPPVMLRFQPDAAYALGAQLNDGYWTVLLTNLDARPAEKLEIAGGGSTEQAVTSLAEGLEELRARLGRGRLLPAVGIGAPGLVDTRTGVIKSAVDTGLFDLPLAEMAERALGMRALVANRSKLGALTELWHGGEPAPGEIIYLSIGPEIAAGIIHRGELYLGANSGAGEIGHMTVLPEGPTCPCGNRGCLQQLVSEQAIVNRARSLLRQTAGGGLRRTAGDHSDRLSVQAVVRAAEAGDELARRVIEEAAEYLAVAAGTLINLLNPELIVLGGSVGAESAHLLQQLREKVRSRAMAYPLSGVTIRRCTFGPDSGAVGAAVMVLQQVSELLFSEPQSGSAGDGGT